MSMRKLSARLRAEDQEIIALKKVKIGDFTRASRKPIYIGMQLGYGKTSDFDPGALSRNEVYSIDTVLFGKSYGEIDTQQWDSWIPG